MSEHPHITQAVIPAPPDLWYLDTTRFRHIRALYIVTYIYDPDWDPDDVDTNVYSEPHDHDGYVIQDTEIAQTCPTAEVGWWCPGHKDDPEYNTALKTDGTA